MYEVMDGRETPQQRRPRPSIERRQRTPRTTRMRTQIVCATLTALLVAGPALAGPEEDVAAATQAWAEAFSRHDLEGLLRLYDPGAVFWGTSSATLRDNPAAIRDYFKGVPTSRMIVRIGDARVRVFGDTAIATGHYTFVDVRDGKEVPRPARFSFTYRLRDGRWVIVDHHSSSVPAGR
jgi:uncharacterized protein (TIGR02246 family)